MPTSRRAGLFLLYLEKILDLRSVLSSSKRGSGVGSECFSLHQCLLSNNGILYRALNIPPSNCEISNSTLVFEARVTRVKVVSFILLGENQSDLQPSRSGLHHLPSTQLLIAAENLVKEGPEDLPSVRECDDVDLATIHV